MSHFSRELCPFRYSQAVASCLARARGLLAVMTCSLVALGQPLYGMEPLDDPALADVSGTGLAFALDDFRFQAAPTSYIEQIGGEPASGTTFARGDLRWFGVTLSNWDAGEFSSQRTTWEGTCGNGYNNMGCPISTQGIGDYANHDNPFLLRVFEYQRVGLNAAGNDWVGSPVVDGTSAGGVNRTVLDLLGPSDSQDWRWSFWGEIQASDTDGSGNITNVLGVLRNQNLILGKPAAYSRPPSIFGTGAGNPLDGAMLRMFQYRGQRLDGSGTSILDETMGLVYHHRLSGNYRFSLNQKSGSLSTDPVPQFSNQEGLYFTDVNAFLPLGQLYYQGVVLDSVKPVGGGAGDGNFIIELTSVPNDPNAYNDLYSIAGDNGYRRYGRNDRYYETHGYVEWGSQFPTCTGGGANGSIQCMSGSGVSGVRYAGLDPDGVTRIINQTNYPGHANCGYDECTWSGQTVGHLVSAPSSRAQVVGQGGMAFASRGSTTRWGVRHMQGRPSSTAITSTRTQNYSCGLFCTNTRLILERHGNYNANTYNPEIQMNAINLGASRVQGLALQYLRITSLGAAN